MDVTITKGFDDDERAQVAALYWQAFSGKLRYVLGPPGKAQTFIGDHLNPEFALVARDPNGAILGVAGFKTHEGALIGGKMSDLARIYGWLSALWRGPLLGLVERDLEDDVLLMDGICVGAAARGMGVGTALLNGIKEEARTQNKRSVRLDVIDTNPRARALYERQGFVSIGTENLGPLALVFGFQSSTKMRSTVEAS